MLSTPGLVQVFCLFMVAFASLVTVQVLWAGPYLHDVYGLDTVERGNVLLGMASCRPLACWWSVRSIALQHAQVGVGGLGMLWH